MPACGYEFYLLVFNSDLTRSLRSLVRYGVEHSKIKSISTRKILGKVAENSTF